ncbi:unannotated protein [freshwater metagenome]|uniref:Unannotated protein n=1 Tax=freshwater metagenome TaxID=449393 RepID=A0A6J5ZNC8_9ZZZZ
MAFAMSRVVTSKHPSVKHGYGKRSSPLPCLTPDAAAIAGGPHNPIFSSKPTKYVLTENAVPLSILNAPERVEFLTGYGAIGDPPSHSVKSLKIFFDGAERILKGSQPCLRAAAIVKTLKVEPAWNPTVPLCATGAL